MRQIQAENFDFNPFKLIGKDWMLISAGDEKKANTMTASWGGVGIMWGSPCATVYIRPQRYTLNFVEDKDTFSLCFFNEEYRSMLSKAGKISGKDCDKIKELKLTPVFEYGTVYYEEAETVIICKKQYVQNMLSECFVDKDAEEKWYQNKDYHRMFMGKIEKILVK